MGGVKKSLFWNLINQFSRFGLSLLALVILARLLTPEDYGIFGILTIFTSIADQLSDSGMGGYIIKKRNTTEEDYNTLFVFNMVVSITLYGILFIAAPFIADFYESDTVCSAIRVLALAIVIQAFAITQKNRLYKDLRFKTNAIINLAAGMAALLSAIILAYFGFGVWALIAQQLVLAIVSTILCVVCTRHIPKFRFKFIVFKEQFSFGVHLLLASLLKAFSKNIVNNVVGKVFSLSLTGYYTQASKMQSYPLAITSGVVDTTFFPIFSKLNNDIDLLRAQSMSVTRGMYAVLFPVFGFLICFAQPLIEFVLGAKWIESVPFFRILMIASFFMLTRAMNRNILKSLGRTAYIFRMEVVSTIVLGVFLLVAIFFDSIIVMTYAFVLSQVASAIYTIFKLKNVAGYPIKTQILNFITYIPISVVPFVAIYIVGNSSLIINVAIYLLLTLVVFVVYRIWGVRDYEVIIKSLLNRKSNK